MFVHLSFVLFVSFVAYATGAVVCKRASSSRASAVVHPLEMAVVVCLLVVIALLHPKYSIVHLVVSTLAMLMIGAATARATLVTTGRATAGTREFEEVHVADGPSGLWKRWLNISRALADYEFRLLLVAIYLLVICPFALTIRALRSTPTSDTSNWIPRRNDTPSLDAARRPF